MISALPYSRNARLSCLMPSGKDTLTHWKCQKLMAIVTHMTRMLLVAGFVKGFVGGAYTGSSIYGLYV